MTRALAVLIVLGLAPLAPAWAATTESLSDDAMERAAEKLITEGVDTRPTKSVEKAALSEDDTPVVISEAPPAKTGGSMIWRLLASVALLAVAAGGLHFFTRRYGRSKNVGGQQSRIELMHQFHLGPRKSLALVRVAGETMLIGVTDQNINMLKSITLIDDDMAAAMNQDFNGFLEDEYAVSDVNHIGRRNQ